MSDENKEWGIVRFRDGTRAPYKVNRSGEVISLVTGKQMHGAKRKTDGAFVITLSNFNHSETHSIHKLVASAFISENLDGKFITHIDGNIENNSVENLAVVYGNPAKNYIPKLRDMILILRDEFVACNKSPEQLCVELDLSMEFLYLVLYKKDFLYFLEGYDFNPYLEKFGITSFRYKDELREKLIKGKYSKKEIIGWLMDSYQLNDLQAKFIVESQDPIVNLVATNAPPEKFYRFDKLLFVSDLIIQGKDFDTIKAYYYAHFSENRRPSRVSKECERYVVRATRGLKYGICSR